MFSKGNKPTGTPAPAPAPSSPSMATAPAPASPSAPPKPTASAVPSIISADLKIVGNMQSNGDIQIDGQVEGDVVSRTLTVGEGALVKGSVRGETVRICGQVQGEVNAASVIIAKTARESSDVVHPSLAIEAGAYLEGNIRRMEPNRPTGMTASAPVLKPGEGLGGLGGGGMGGGTKPV